MIYAFSQQSYGNSRCKSSVDYLREFFNVQKGQLERNSDFVKYIIQSSVNNVNVDKNTNIEIAQFKSIKRPRITIVTIYWF